MAFQSRQAGEVGGLVQVDAGPQAFFAVFVALDVVVMEFAVRYQFPVNLQLMGGGQPAMEFCQVKRVGLGCVHR
jgi:hypothetical protein